MHPTIQYQLAQSIAADRIKAADRPSRSIAATADRERRAPSDLHRLMSGCRRLARRITSPADLSTER